MKKAKMNINFQNNTSNTLGENIPLVTISYGHYASLLTHTQHTINNPNSFKNLTISDTNEKPNQATAVKLRCQFVHSAPEKLTWLISNARSP